MMLWMQESLTSCYILGDSDGTLDGGREDGYGAFGCLILPTGYAVGG
jgi:hypothetical protein